MIIRHPERHLPERKFFNQETSEFIIIPEMTLKAMYLKLEHSLISVREWEAANERSFSEMMDQKPTVQDIAGYIRFMTINKPADESVYDSLTGEDITRVVEYIQKPSSAWTIKPQKDTGRRRKQANTVESIIFAMIRLGIPFDPCEKWHLNSLLALIDYCSQNGNGGKEKPKSMRDMREMWYRMNETNRKKYHSRG